MFATATLHTRPLVNALEGLRTLLPGVTLGLGKAWVAYDEAVADWDYLSSQTLDELELLSGEGCISDWGLVERAGRLRSGWS